MTSNTAVQLRIFNALQRPKLDPRGAPNHWHFDIRELPDAPGELVFLANPHSRKFHGEGRTKISDLSISMQAKVIVPLLLEAFVTQFDEDPEQLMNDEKPFVPFSWSTGNPALARAVSARCKSIGIRSELCSVQVSDANTVSIAGECYVKWRKDIEQAMMMMFGYPEDDGEANIEWEGGCEYCHFTPSLDKPLFPCGECDGVVYCSTECQKLDAKFHGEMPFD